MSVVFDDQGERGSCGEMERVLGELFGEGVWFVG